MILSLLIGIIVAVCLLSTLFFYVVMRSRESLKSSLSKLSINKQQIKYSFRPSMDIITKTITPDFSLRTSVSSNKSNRSSSSIIQYDENEFKNNNNNNNNLQRKSNEPIKPSISSVRSLSMITNLFQPRRPRSSIHWRQGSIIDPNQMALIKFSLPPNHNTKYRRRSVAVCNNIIEPKENSKTIIDSISPCLLSFSITYLKTCQIKIEFHLLQSLPSNIILQQLTIKAKLIPDGKEKSFQLKKTIENETRFTNDNNQLTILFSNIQYEKLHERSLLLTICGKDQNKRRIHLGHIGKINFSEIKKFDNENQIDFIHEIEKTKPSTIELYVSLEKRDDQHIHLRLQRIKGLKIDQKKLDATCYCEILLLDRHRLLNKQKTKDYRLNSSNFDIGEQFDLKILTYNSNNFDRLMIVFNLYSNSNQTNEYKCLANVKFASPLLCSGSGTVHWEQFKARESFSMWHTLNKEQH